MKKSKYLPLAVALLLTACGGVQETRTSYTSLEISEAITDTLSVSGDMDALAYGDDHFADYVSNYYGIEAETLADGAVRYEGGASAGEIAVLELDDDARMDAAEKALRQYIENRTASFYGYMPDQVVLLEQAAVVANGNHVALLICDDPRQAEAAFLASFGEREAANAALAAFTGAGGPADTAAAVSAKYDHDAILAAYRAGDSSRLSAKNKRILEGAARAIDEVITDGMSDYEKELAIHDWIIDWAHYDIETKNQSPDARPNPENDNPYGLLVDGEAICSGYSSTFQLLMDMLEIPCMTVEGAAYQRTNEHSWNMVRLDGEWYCVDLTWNDPTLEDEDEDWDQHLFFNVTSQYMEDTEHLWDAASIPEATGVAYGRADAGAF